MAKRGEIRQKSATKKARKPIDYGLYAEGLMAGPEGKHCYASLSTHAKVF
jgi:hypothetical protein